MIMVSLADIKREQPPQKAGFFVFMIQKWRAQMNSLLPKKSEISSFASLQGPKTFGLVTTNEIPLLQHIQIPTH